MRFASVDTFLELGDWGYRMGRPIANAEFLRALLRFGRFDDFTFFALDASQAKAMRRATAQLLGSNQLPSQVRVLTQAKLSATLRTETFDVLHQGDFTYFGPFLAELRNRHARPPCPITGVTHSLDGFAMHQRFLQLASCDLDARDGIICTSEAAATLVRTRLARARELLRCQVNAADEIQTRVIPLGIDDELFEPMDRARVRRELGIDPTALLALSVGRLSLRTKLDWAPILESIARLRALRALPENFLLLIAGGASEDSVSLLRSIIEKYDLGSTVRIVANFAAGEKRKLYAAADLFLSMVDNLQETFGLSVIEAMAAGLPIIASDLSGYRDSVEHNVTGCLIPTFGTTTLPTFLEETWGLLDPMVSRLYVSQMTAFDVPAFERTLAELVASDAGRRKLGDAGRARAERYRWKTIIDAYEDFWTHLRGSAARRERPQTRALLRGDGVEGYAHFFSQPLCVTHEAQITDFGRVALSNPEVLVRYHEMLEVLEPDLERAILEHLARASCSIASLRATVAEATATPSADIDFHVLWLTKHGAIALR